MDGAHEQIRTLLGRYCPRMAAGQFANGFNKVLPRGIDGRCAKALGNLQVIVLRVLLAGFQYRKRDAIAGLKSTARKR